MDDYGDLNDEALVSCILDGDRNALVHLLIDRCGGGIKYLAQSKFRTADMELDEAVSELYILLQHHEFRALRAFRGANSKGVSCKLTHYIFCIAARLLSRKQKNIMKEKCRTLSLDEMKEDMPDHSTEVQRRMSPVEIVDLVMALPDPVDRAVLMLYKVEGKDVEEVARLLNMTTGNVYTRCSRALGILRRRLLKEKRT